MADSYIVSTALMKCSFGTIPCPFVANPSRTVFMTGKQRGNINDFMPIVNIGSFGMCSAPTNPAVIAATAAKLGVFSPAPCVPAVSTPWIPGKPDILIQGMPALTKSSCNLCMWLGQISFSTTGQTPVPPPMTMPPIGKMGCMPTGKRKPLTNTEIKSLPPDDQEQYEKDMAAAEKSGRTEDIMANIYEKNASDFAKKGQTEYAQVAQQRAEASRVAAEEKRQTAIGDVNQKYREMLPPSEEQMNMLSPQQRADYERKNAEITETKKRAYREADIDRQLSDNVSNEMLTNHNIASGGEMMSEKSGGFLISITGAVREHYAKKDADEAEMEARKKLNQDTHRQIDTACQRY